MFYSSFFAFIFSEIGSSKENVDPTVIQQSLNNLWSTLIEFGERLIIAGIVFFIANWLINILRKVIKKVLYAKRLNGAVQSFINSLVNTVLKTILLILIIGILGIETTSFAAIIAAAGLAIGMAMKDNLSNFAGGVMILLNKPFNINDYIEAQGKEGIVKEIGVLYTVITTPNGQTVFIPNGPLSTGSIINYSLEPYRRYEYSFNLSSGYDAGSIKKLILNEIQNSRYVLHNPVPFVGITAVKNGNFDVTLRAWCRTPEYEKMIISLNEAVYDAFIEKGIIPAK